jgi:trans-aconitate methyltransferase
MYATIPGDVSESWHDNVSATAKDNGYQKTVARYSSTSVQTDKFYYSLLVSCFGWFPGDVAQFTFISCEQYIHT